MLIIRRVLVSFTGSELTLGVFWGAWTFWTACGSWLSGKFAYRAKNKKRFVILLFITYLAAFTLTFVGAYLIKSILRVPQWEEVGIIEMLKTSFLLLCPMCVLLGALFPVVAQLSPLQSGDAVSETYSWEAFGAGVGGISANLLALVLKPMESVAAICALMLIVSAIFSKKTIRTVMFLLSLPAIVGVFSSTIDKYLLSKVWVGYPIEVAKDSRYSNIVLTIRESEAALFSDGTPTITFPAGAVTEEIVHIPMLLHPHPNRVLLVGGSLLTTGKEILKYPLKKLDYCQLDPAIVDMEKKLCSMNKTFCENPWEDASLFESKRVKIHLTDGKRFLRESPESVYDVVIFDVGAPHTLGLNRYFTKEIFELAKKTLKENGLICFGVGEYANYIAPPQGRFLSLMKNTVKKVFGNSTVLPLSKFYFIAGKNHTVEADAEVLDAALMRKGISTVWFKRETYRANLTEERIKNLYTAIEQNQVKTLNEDYKPLGFIYWLDYWATLFPDTESKTIKKIMSLSARRFLVLLLIFAIIGVGMVLAHRGGRKEKIGIAWAIVGTGFAEMCLSIAVLYATQLRLGTLFFLIGFLVTSLMFGMGTGGIVCRWTVDKGAKKALVFSLSVLATISVLVGFFLPLVLRVVGNLPAIILLNSVAFIVASLGGFVYASSAKIGEKSEGHSAMLGGFVNSADLFGTAVGAVLAGTVMLPVWGFAPSCYMASAVVFTTCMVCVLSFVKG